MRYLAPRRVASLGDRALFTYLSTVLAKDNDLTSPIIQRTLDAVIDDPARDAEIRRRAGRLSQQIGRDSQSLERPVASLLEIVAERAGIDLERACSDIDSDTSPPHRARVPIAVYLPHVRSPYNVGNIIRSSAAFAVSGVVLGEACPDLAHPRAKRAAMGAASLVDVIRGTLEDARSIAAGDGGSQVVSLPIVVLETGGKRIDLFQFPERGVLIAGHEELGVDPELLAAAKSSGGVVSIPLAGKKRSLNVGVAVGIALSWWCAALDATD